MSDGWRVDGDTIAAVSTPWGKGAIGIVRVSGDEAIEVARRVAPDLGAEPPPHRAQVKWVLDPKSREPIDQAVIWISKAPRSYTGEDMAEIQGHGGVANMERVLEAVMESGARLAAPGEFTMRAFVNGRMDLAQAQGVCELIEARTRRAHQAAVCHLRGGLSGLVEGWWSEVLDLLAEVEASVDFPDEELDFLPCRELIGRSERLAAEVGSLASTHRRARLLSKGAVVGIVGRTNVGKSSLLNALVGKKRVVVDDEPGTTRDFVEASVEIGGVEVTLVDTAGRRSGGGRAEREGSRLAEEMLGRAEMVVCVADGGVGVVEEDVEVWEAFCDIKRQAVWNKMDLVEGGEVEGKGAWRDPLAKVSALTGEGIETLRRKIGEEVGVGDIGAESVVVTEVRQRNALLAAQRSLHRSAAALKEKRPREVVAIELGDAATELGSIIGRGVGQEVLSRIFSRFCVGK